MASAGATAGQTAAAAESRDLTTDWGSCTIILGSIQLSVAQLLISRGSEGLGQAEEQPELCVVGFCPLSSVASAPITEVHAIAPDDAVAAASAAVQQRAALGATSAGVAGDPVASRLDAAAASRAITGASTIMSSAGGAAIGALAQALFDLDAAALLCKPLLPGQSQAEARVTHCLMQAPLAPLVSSPQTLTAIGSTHILTLRTLRHPGPWPTGSTGTQSGSTDTGSVGSIAQPVPSGVCAAGDAFSKQGSLHVHGSGRDSPGWEGCGGGRRHHSRGHVWQRRPGSDHSLARNHRSSGHLVSNLGC